MGSVANRVARAYEGHKPLRHRDKHRRCPSPEQTIPEKRLQLDCAEA